MSALLSVTFKVKDPYRLKDYTSRVPVTMAPFNDKMLSRGKIGKTFNVEFNHQIEGVFEFPSEAALEG